MWLRTLRLIWWLFFVWAAVLGFRHGSWSWVIVPVFTMACLFIAQEYVTKHYPQFAPNLNVALLALLFVYNIAFTIWPSFVKQLPWTAAALIGQKSRKDFETAMELDPGPLKAQQVLAKYRQQASDAEADAIERGLKELIEKRRSGHFSPEDARTEQELVLRFERLVQHSEELKKLITKVPTVGAAQQAYAGPPKSPESTSGAQQRIAIPAPVHGIEVPTAKPRPGSPADSEKSRVSETMASPPASRVEQLDSLVNTLPSSNLQRVAVVVALTDGPPTLERTFYRALKSYDGRVTPDLFRESEFRARGFFDEIEAGNTSNLVRTKALNLVQFLLIGRMRRDCNKQLKLDSELVTCTVSLTTKLFDKSGAIMSSDTFSALAAGFSESAASEEACQKVAASVSRGVLPAN